MTNPADTRRCLCLPGCLGLAAFNRCGEDSNDSTTLSCRLSDPYVSLQTTAHCNSIRWFRAKASLTICVLADRTLVAVFGDRAGTSTAAAVGSVAVAETPALLPFALLPLLVLLDMLHLAKW